jgi:hypothetical protein
MPIDAETGPGDAGAPGAVRPLNSLPGTAIGLPEEWIVWVGREALPELRRDSVLDGRPGARRLVATNPRMVTVEVVDALAVLGHLRRNRVRPS